MISLAVAADEVVDPVERTTGNFTALHSDGTDGIAPYPFAEAEIVGVEGAPQIYRIHARESRT